MKGFLFFLIFVGALVGVLYFTGTFEFDPDKDAAEVRAAVDKPGMPWTQVVAVSKPRKWRIYNEKKQMIDGREIISYNPGPEVPFEGNNIAERLADGTLPGGFSFRYNFGGDAFEVKFDAAGQVEAVHDLITQKDLLDNR